MSVHVPADYTAETYREIFAFSRISSARAPQWMTAYQRAGLYLALAGTPSRAVDLAHYGEDQDAEDLLYPLLDVEHELDRACRLEYLRYGECSGPRAGAFEYDHTRQDAEPRRGRARRRRVARTLFR